MNKRQFHEILQELGWSQARLARALGMHVNTVSGWVRRDTVPGYAAEYLRVVLLAHRMLSR